MVLRRFNGWVLVLAGLIAAAVSVIERGFAWLVSRLEPIVAGPRLALDGPALGFTGTAIDGALQQSMRHEAGMSRRAAARNT